MCIRNNVIHSCKIEWNRKVKREERIKKKKEKWIEEGMEKMEG